METPRNETSKNNMQPSQNAPEQLRPDEEEIGEEELEQVSGGSQSTGAGSGKVTFNPFSITHKIDKASPTFFTQ